MAAISTVQLDIADFLLTVLETPMEARGAWVTELARSLAKRDLDGHEYARKLILEVEDYRRREADRKAGLKKGHSMDSKEGAERHGTGRNPGESKDGAGILAHTHNHTSNHSDNQTHNHPLSPLRVDSCISLYAPERVREGRGEPLTFGGKEKKTLAKILEETPEYPMELAIMREAKRGAKIRDPKNFLSNLPTPESIRPAAVADFKKTVRQLNLLSKPMPSRNEDREFWLLHDFLNDGKGFQDFLRANFPEAA